MSALGQKQTFALQKAMSALPPIATAKADICTTSNRWMLRQANNPRAPMPITSRTLHPRNATRMLASGSCYLNAQVQVDHRAASIAVDD